MSEEKSQVLIRFREHLGGFFYDVLRAAGITTPMTTAHARIHQIGERMAKTIEAAAEAKSIEVIRRLQKAIIASFDKVEKELNNILKTLVIHQKVLTELNKKQEELDKQISSLREQMFRDVE